MVEYACDGLFGVLTPQANTTAEPELAILCPPGMAFVTARLVSRKAIMDDRLVDYVETLEATLDRFANAPLKAVAFACTGASYLVDPALEAQRLKRIADARGLAVITAADAVADALACLGATKVGIVSPYGDPLHDRGLAYWRGRGLEIDAVERINPMNEAFHPIYALDASAASGKLQSLMGLTLDAAVLLGTGLATLPAIHALRSQPMPVISPNLCLMWRVAVALGGERPSIDTLRPWLTGNAWGARYEARIAG
jgi:maleate cis-trans isomerase